MKSNSLLAVIQMLCLFVVMGCLLNPQDQSAELNTEDSLKIALRDSLRKIELAIEDSIMHARIRLSDSLRQAKRDSIDAAHAYANRPWKLDYLVDDFGSRTYNKCIETNTSGLFSNSATSNSYLFVRILLTSSNGAIFLHEYRKSNPAARFIGKGEILVRNSEYEVVKIFNYAPWSQSGGLLIDKTNFIRFKDFLMESEGEVQFVIRDAYSSEYQFSIDVSGIKAEYDLL